MVLMSQNTDSKRTASLVQSHALYPTQEIGFVQIKTGHYVGFGDSHMRLFPHKRTFAVASLGLTYSPCALTPQGSGLGGCT